MTRLSIQSDFRDVQRMLERLSDDVRNRATGRALNKVVEQGRTEMVRRIAAEFVMTQREARERMRIRPARFARGKLQLEAELFVSNTGRRSLNLIRFVQRSVTLAAARRAARAGTLRTQGRGNRALPLTFRIKRVGGVKTLKGAFIANKGRTVFRRMGQGRLPIEGVQTIDVGQMFNTRRINAAVIARIKAQLPIVMAQEVRFALASRARVR